MCLLVEMSEEKAAVFPTFVSSMRGLLLLCLLGTALYVQAEGPDSTRRRGFSSPREAGDSLLSYLTQEKDHDIMDYAVDEKMFHSEFRKSDTLAAEQMVLGQYLNYTYKLKKSFQRTRKNMLKEELSLKKITRDTLLFYANSGTGDMKKCELYISQRKYKGYIVFNLWKIEGEWYLGDRIELITTQEK
jgi:hypothetical protein